MEFLGQQITVALIVSAFTSLIVSVLSFSIGIRVGKERIDRLALRAIYKSLYQHFGDIEKSLLSGNPKQWDHYPLKGNNYFPVAKEMKVSGELAMLPETLARQIQEQEEKALNSAWAFKSHIDSKVLPVFKEFIAENVSQSDIPINGVSYIALKIGALVLDDGKALNAAQARLNDNVRGVGIETSQDRSKSVTIYIYPEKLNSGTVGELLTRLSAILKSVHGTSSVSDDIRSQHTRLKALLELIASRVNDPHPFGETIRRSIPDLLKF